MSRAEKVRRIIQALTDRVDVGNEPSWSHWTSDAPELVPVAVAGDYYECVFSSTNTVVVTPNAVALLKHGVVVYVYTGNEVANLYWNVRGKVEGDALLDSLSLDLDNLP